MEESYEGQPLASVPSKSEALGLSSLPDLSASPCVGPQIQTLKCVLYKVFKAYINGKQYDRKCPRLVIRKQRCE